MDSPKQSSTEAVRSKETLAQQVVRTRRDIWKYIRAGLPQETVEDAIVEYEAMGAQAAEEGNKALASLVIDGADRLRSELGRRVRADEVHGIDEEETYDEDPDDAGFLPRDHTYRLDDVRNYDDPRLFFLKPYFTRIRSLDVHHFGFTGDERQDDSVTLNKILALRPSQVHDIEYGYEIYKEMSNPVTETFTDASGVVHTVTTKTDAAEMYKWVYFSVWPDVAMVLQMYGRDVGKHSSARLDVSGEELSARSEKRLVDMFELFEHAPVLAQSYIDIGVPAELVREYVEGVMEHARDAKRSQRGRTEANIAEVKLNKILGILDQVPTDELSSSNRIQASGLSDLGGASKEDVVRVVKSYSEEDMEWLRDGYAQVRAKIHGQAPAADVVTLKHFLAYPDIIRLRA